MIHLENKRVEMLKKNHKSAKFESRRGCRSQSKSKIAIRQMWRCTMWHSTFEIKCEKLVRCLRALLSKCLVTRIFCIQTQTTTSASSPHSMRKHWNELRWNSLPVEKLRMGDGGRHCLVCFRFKCFDYHNGQRTVAGKQKASHRNRAS